ncbi:MAG: peptidoglycan editing factor PgeF [Burkholderiales bacterium]|nr:peptidoglycan editing factor PgeF [Burkholderiales bacterium]
MDRPHPDWIVPEWPAHESVRAFVTTRAGGASRGAYETFNLGRRTDDDPAAVDSNRAALRGLLPAEPLWLKQVHGARVVDADRPPDTLEADAAVSRNPGTVCAVLVADCVPVLFSDRAGTAVAAAHAGWRGMAAGVLENTVRAMPVRPVELLAFLGPGIGPRAFEVGADVRDAFLAADAGASDAFAARKPGKWLADLYALARRRLARAGVERVFGGGLCTWSDTARFYSHRRDGPTGRMAAVIWRVP